MHQPNIHEVREKLAEYLDAAARGEDVLICRRNQPVARLVAVRRAPRKPRPIGRAPDAGAALPASFWEPLPQELLDALGGHDVPAAVVPAPASASVPVPVPASEARRAAKPPAARPRGSAR